MDAWLLLPVIPLFLIAVAVFLIWVAVSKARWAYRRQTRSHLYVPVTAKVTRVLFHGNGGRVFATIVVRYEHAGAVIDNRFTLFNEAAARAAKESKVIRLEIDPDYPRDVRAAEPFASSDWRGF